MENGKYSGLIECVKEVKKEREQLEVEIDKIYRKKIEHLNDKLLKSGILDEYNEFISFRDALNEEFRGLLAEAWNYNDKKSLIFFKYNKIYILLEQYLKEPDRLTIHVDESVENQKIVCNVFEEEYGFNTSTNDYFSDFKMEYEKLYEFYNGIIGIYDNYKDYVMKEYNQKISKELSHNDELKKELEVFNSEGMD